MVLGAILRFISAVQEFKTLNYVLAPGVGFEPTRPEGHRLSRPAPYQARKPRLQNPVRHFSGGGGRVLRFSKPRAAQRPSISRPAVVAMREPGRVPLPDREGACVRVLNLYWNLNETVRWRWR